ncbi:MAG: hypothetical protein WC719_01515 [Patescibacteria group bacterium]|jgi:hypothetical protein
MLEKFSFNNVFKKKEDESINQEPSKTPDRLISYGEKIIKMFCKNYETEGDDDLRKFKAEHPEDKFIFTASHTNNLDVTALLKTFGNDFNLQVTGNELFFEKAKYLAQNIGVRTLFQDNFTRLGQKESSDKKEYGVFRPENFEELDKKMDQGRTPWMAAHSFSADGEMRKVDNGALIEAYRQNAWIIPTALEIKGGSDRLQGVGDLAKNLKEDSGAKYHVGQPYKPEPLPEGLDIKIISQVVSKRQSGEKVSDEEFEAFKKVNHFLSEQSEKLGRTISTMLPEEQRGYYRSEKKEEEK